MPPILRVAEQIAWFDSTTKPSQYDNDLFMDYITGSTYANYASVSAYTAGDRVIFTDGGVYENLTGSTGIIPTNINNWSGVNESYIGAIERSKYQAQKYLYEYALNRWFQMTGITTSSYFGPSAHTYYIQTLTAFTQSFLMGSAGEYSDVMPRQSTQASAFMCGNFSSANPYEYIIWYPTGYTSASTIEIKSFADTVNIAGMLYSISGY